VLTVQIVGDTSGLDSALGKATGGINVFGQQLSVGGIAKVAAFAGVAGIAVSAIAEMTAAAAADRDEANKLALAIRNATGSTEDYTAATEAAITAGQQRAFTDSETRDALGTLVTATKDVDAATALLATTQDIARAANVDLATAADAVAKAQQGNGRALSALMPGLTASKDATDILAAAQTQAAGAADAFAASSEGQALRTSDAFGELTETLGSAFLPILDALLPALVPLINKLAELIEAVLPVLTPMIHGLVQVLGTLVDSWVALADFITGTVLPALAPVQGMLTNLLDRVIPPLTDLVRTLGDAFKTLGDIAAQVAGFIGGIVKSAQDAIKAIGDLIDQINFIPDVGGIVGDIGGGITDALPDLWSAPAAGSAEAPSAAAFGATPRSAGGRAGNVTINVIGDPMTIERTVIRALRTHYRRAGIFPADLGRTA
jgi:hypothetical protein